MLSSLEEKYRTAKALLNFENILLLHELSSQESKEKADGGLMPILDRDLSLSMATARFDAQWLDKLISENYREIEKGLEELQKEYHPQGQKTQQHMTLAYIKDSLKTIAQGQDMASGERPAVRPGFGLVCAVAAVAVAVCVATGRFLVGVRILEYMVAVGCFER